MSLVDKVLRFFFAGFAFELNLCDVSRIVKTKEKFGFLIKAFNMLMYILLLKVC